MVCITTLIRRICFCLALALVVLFLDTFVLTATAAKPKTIPALRDWEDSPGSYVFGPGARIVIDGAYFDELCPTASVFASDLFVLTGYTIPILEGDRNVGAGDIYMTLGSTDHSIGEEGYVLTVGNHITVVALTEAGVFYGTRSILQILRQGFRIDNGVARDWPDYPERGLMLDVGRKFLSVQFLRRHIKELAYLKLNYLHLHLSDEASDGSGTYGFRLESITHPEITSPEHYSRADIRSLIALARSYHVTIVPEIDVPSHSLAMLAPHPELALPGLPARFDLSNPASYTLIKSLLEEFLPLFPGPFWHSGTDEYLSPSDYANYPQLLTYAQQHYGPQANAQDTYIGFVNWLDGIVKAHGKQMRTWNDIYGVTGNVNVPNSDIILEIWYPYISPNDALSKGHTIMNTSLLTLYYDPGIDSLTNDPQNAVNLYEKWAPNLQWPDTSLVWPGDINLLGLTPGLRGAKFQVWFDFPNLQTENQIQDNIAIHLRGLAQNSWGSPKLVPDLISFSSIVDPIGHTPDWAPDFALMSLTSKGNVKAGQTERVPLIVNPIDGFNQLVGLTCQITNPALGVACAVSAPSVTLSGANFLTATVLVTTEAPSPVVQIPPGLVLDWDCLWIHLCGPCTDAFRHQMPSSNSVHYDHLFFDAVRQSEGRYCLDKRLSPPESKPTTTRPLDGTPAGIYNIVLTGTSGALTHSIEMKVVVE